MATERRAEVADAEPSTAEPPQKTLRDMINRSSEDFGFNPTEYYDACNAETQRELFLGLWREHKPLLRLPTADRVLPTCGRIQRYDEISDPPEGFADAYEIQDQFLQKWVNGDLSLNNELAHHHGDKSETSYTHPTVRWSSMDIYNTPGTPGFEADRDGHGRMANGIDRCSTFELISSQLLLYRLIAVFGMPSASDKEQIDGYKVIWSYTLHCRPDQDKRNMKKGEKSTILFGDYKGSFMIHFSGSEEASKSALKLFEWLVSDNVPHTYDGVLAGNIA